MDGATDLLVNVRVTDIDPKSQVWNNLDKAMEKQKKKKRCNFYLCLDKCLQFTHFNVSTYRMMGHKATIFVRIFYLKLP